MCVLKLIYASKIHKYIPTHVYIRINMHPYIYIHTYISVLHCEAVFSHFHTDYAYYYLF